MSAAAAKISIDKKITGFEVVKDEDKNKSAPQPTPAIETTAIDVAMETMKRPDFLRGSTYKLRSPILESALYITINDIEVTENGKTYFRPFEVFINSKNMEHFQWIVALTRVMSAVFRKGGDITFLVEELQSVFDPSGGYFKKGGKYIPSLVAEIGETLKEHLQTLGIMEATVALRPEQIDLINKKREELKLNESSAEEYPKDARICGKCNTKAVVRLDNCDTCLSCGDGKCG